MGFFNHIFGNKSDIAREIKLDEKQRLELWNEHLSNYSQREQLALFFSFKNIDNALSNPNELISVLEQIEKLISHDLVNIENEEKDEMEILQNIKILIKGN